MKYIFLILLLIASSLVANEKQKVTIGLGAYTQSQPYKGASNLLLPSPVIFFDNSIVYTRWSRFGL